MAVVESRAPELFDKNNRPVFNVVKTFPRTQRSDTSSISALALSPDGDLLAIGYASGIVEIIHTLTWRAVRVWSCSARVVSFVWHSRFTRSYCFATANGVLRLGKLGFKETEDVCERILFSSAIHTIALDEDSSCLIIAYKFDLAVLMDPLPERDHSRTLIIPIPAEYRPTSPPTIHDIPVNVKFINRDVVLVVYLGVALAFESRHPFGLIWVMHPLARSAFGRGIISPDGQEFICQNLTDGIQRYSLIKRTSAVPTGAKHDHLLSLVGRPKNLFYGLDFLDRRTLLTGHNNGCVIVIRDTGRMDSSQRYDTQYIELHKKSKATRFVVAGYVQNKSTVIAVSGEGAQDKIYVIAVGYIRCDPDVGIKVLTIPDNVLDLLWGGIFVAYVAIGILWYEFSGLARTLQLTASDAAMAKVD